VRPQACLPLPTTTPVGITPQHIFAALRHPFGAVRRVICAGAGAYYTWRYVDGGCGKIRVAINPYRLEIRKAQGARFFLNGVLSVASFRNGRDRVSIALDEGSELEIDGDFSIGNGTEVFLSQNARLWIGGVDKEPRSGVTERARIMVKRRITIGRDLPCASDVSITDCDWHSIEGRQPQNDVVIGDHVWVTPGCSILKGTRIGDGSIVSNRTVISGKQFPGGSLIGGNPPTVSKSGVKWNGALDPYQAHAAPPGPDAEERRESATASDHNCGPTTKER
jgi:acetyltransferase-like isoleucine patch superfamily enzyme